MWEFISVTTSSPDSTTDPAADTPGSPRRALALPIVTVLLIVAPIVALDVSPYAANGSLWYLGMLPSLMGLFTGRRLALGAAALTPAIVGISLLLKDLPPIVGALYMAALGVATGLSARRGWHIMFAFSAPLAALALIGNMHVALLSTGERVLAGDSPEAFLLTLAILTAGGLWTAFLGPHALKVVKVHPPARVPARTAEYFAISMGVLVGLASFIALEWLPPNSWWMVLTMYVVVQPRYSESLTRVVHRVGGTFLGATAAAVVVALFHGFPGLVAGLAAILTVAAAWANLKLPYWVFVSFLTPAVVLQTSGATRDLLWAIVDRAAYTLLGALIAVALLAGGHMYLVRRHGMTDTGATTS